MSLPFVTRGKVCPNEKRRTTGNARRKKPPAWRPPPCKFERKVRRPSGTYCSVCAPASDNYGEGGDSLQNLKDLNSSIHRLDEEIQRQRGKVLNDLIRMDERQQTWEKSLRKGTGLVCTCNLNYKTLEGKELNLEEDSTHVSESLKKDPIKKELDSASSSSFYSQSSKQVPHKRKKRRKKIPQSENQEIVLLEDSDSKTYKALIAHLKNENDRLKSDLQEREAKLREAGKKIEEILEENAILTHRLKEVTFKGLNASSTDDKGKWREIDHVLNKDGESYQKELSLLRQKLSDSQVANRNLEIYIDYLKKSYVSVFGSVVTSS